MAGLNDSNKTQISKVSWLSSRHVGKAYGSMVVFFTKDGKQRNFFVRDSSSSAENKHLFECSSQALLSLAAITVKELGIRPIAVKRDKGVAIVLSMVTNLRAALRNRSALHIQDLTIMIRHCPKRAVNLV